MITTVAALFQQTFDRKALLAEARLFHVVERLREIHPADLALSLVSCAMGDEERSIATARRLFEALTGHGLEESSFYSRFTPALLRWLQQLFERRLMKRTRSQRRALADLLGGTSLVDIQALDGSQVTLPKSAAEVLPSTSREHGGFKLTATVSVLYQRLHRVTVTAARPHDRKVLRLDRWLHGVLLLMDRGYSDHRLFADIEDRCGLFLTRLKESSVPTIRHIRRGLGKCHVGEKLDGTQPYCGTVDMDADFSLRSGTRTFRVVGIIIHRPTKSGPKREYLWFVTNLAPTEFDADAVATLYRMRWEVERLFATLKSVGRLDQLRSANVDLIHCFVYATLLGLVLAQDLCAGMREVRPAVEPSLHRVCALLLQHLPKLAAASGSPARFREVVASLVEILWCEGANPNPGRRYKADRYAEEIRRAA